MVDEIVDKTRNLPVTRDVSTSLTIVGDVKGWVLVRESDGPFAGPESVCRFNDLQHQNRAMISGRTKSVCSSEQAMKRRNFILALTASIAVAVVPAQKELRQVSSRFFHSLLARRQTRAKLNETQKRIDTANQDLKAIVQAELDHIEKRGKFAKLDELLSDRDLGPEMAGHHGYVYSIRLEGNGITVSAFPAPGEQLPAIVNAISGPGLASVLARLRKEH